MIFFFFFLFLSSCFFVMFLGFISVAFKGDPKNQIEVIGRGIVDAAGLTGALRKKLGHANLLSVEEVKENWSWKKKIQDLKRERERE